MFDENDDNNPLDADFEDFPMFPFGDGGMISFDGEFDEPTDDMKGKSFPVLALRGMVLFPKILGPVPVSRSISLKAVQKAQKEGQLIAIFTQSNPAEDEPGVEDMHRIGVMARVLRVIKGDGRDTTVLLHAQYRCRLITLNNNGKFLTGTIAPLVEKEPKTKDKKQFSVLVDMVRERAEQFANQSPDIPNGAEEMISNIKNNSFLINFTASNLNIDYEAKQRLLNMHTLTERGEAVLRQLNHELEVLEMRAEIDFRTRLEMDKQQRDYHLTQTIKSIQDELGDGSPAQDTDDLVLRAKAKKWSAATQATFDKELKKLRRMNTMQPDYGIQLSYLETLLDLPWGAVSDANFDIAKAEKQLQKDHFGLEKIKERILEHLAILKLKGDMKAPIICLVGPPGVGKTSLGKSIAAALGRNYHRIAMGGLHDEAEIRGHRRTYIGAMPGRIIQGLKKIKTDNPVILLDEVDKIGRDHRGDPQSALLEVLDPEQNHAFHDNYIDLDYDLSKVLFIATANSLDGISSALLDRMEVIRLSGYTIEEKTEIATQHLLSQQIKKHGLKTTQIKLKPAVIAQIIQGYTREAGVRDLDRKLAAVCRGVAKRVAMSEKYTPQLSLETVETILGTKPYSDDFYHEEPTPGVAVGLAWTSVGGDILYIETSISQGKGNLLLTGNLGDVMKESATTALSFLRANYALLDIAADAIDQQNIHIHVPEGATPKDGPSAGITMMTAIASAFTKRPVRPHLAMTGEITLRGKVLPVGGIKEKILAAKRAGIKDIILCKDNQKDILEIPAHYLEGLTMHYVNRMPEVLKFALS